ncbi:RHS repeat-associated protein [Rhodoligotrophos appendicifer]|uniref:SpvB/TcaC N-terminal domain-containing protein n=1 Tax=Rhodoligotrophos appendicifer TaxID=987056 RepID=UPI001184F1D4|nr:SpvB/TcaC N-terminal domain-containing protein [Rhodoligotrophos appendicifer]
MGQLNSDPPLPANTRDADGVGRRRDQAFTSPTVSLPKGGGAFRGIGEKFAANPVTGTGSLALPLPLSPGRSSFTPQIALTYDSGAGNGPYGFGWSLNLPRITRRTDRGLPTYGDGLDGDVFILSGAEDLVPVLGSDGAYFEEQRDGYRITRFRPRTEGLFARIEYWCRIADSRESHWRSISSDNVTTLYGASSASRISDPDDPTRIFSWLACETFDAKGNAAVYQYLPEDIRNVDFDSPCEANRRDADRTANRYLKRILYGNATSRRRQADLSLTRWCFELVFDYGDHDAVSPTVEPDRPWPVRPDPFSVYRPGFEIRTYRRCQRFLMFHRFAELGADAQLVRSLALDYQDLPDPEMAAPREELGHPGSTRLGSFLRRAVMAGHAESGFSKPTPPLEFRYSRPTISNETQSLDASSAADLPWGVDGIHSSWVDLNSEGMPGVLSRQGETWWYKPNFGAGKLGDQQPVAQAPSGRSGLRFLDLAGDGTLDAVQLEWPQAGFFEREDEAGWSAFTPFASQPNVDWSDPNLRLVDLTGDGHADILITGDEAISWHASLGEEGFGPRQSTPFASDDSAGPRLVFHDRTETLFLADMSGDGLADLVRLRNGEVTYWPNLGYGRFGAKVTMAGAPTFDAPEHFNPGRIRLADIDGSGVTDILYLAEDGVRLYFNRAGNGWTPPVIVGGLPPIDDVANVSVVDLLANGTACLVWSRPLPNHVQSVLSYVDLMGGSKPHLLTSFENNLGARTVIHYASSARFYLADKQAGRPWLTHLPFPVHVVERTEVYDQISRTRFTTRFAYHHGHFDGKEREFCGFGMIEQWDTEEFGGLDPDGTLPPAANADAASHVPPVLTRSWYHTGLYLGRDRVSSAFAGLLDPMDVGEYYREPGLTDAQARLLLLEDTVLPAGLTADEEREACRALKGGLLRREVYALDGTDKAPHPYSVIEQNFALRLLQQRGSNKHAVFFAHPRESIVYYYERDPADPRIAQALTLEVDAYGNSLKTASVAYGRRQPDPALDPADQEAQGEVHIVLNETDVTNAIEDPDAYRKPVPAEQRSFSLTGLGAPGQGHRFTADEILAAAVTAATLPYHQSPTPGLVQSRLIEHVRTLYRRDDLAGPLPLGTIEPMALPFEAYRLALTPELVAQVYGPRVTESMLLSEGRYVHSQGDDLWWIPSGRAFLSPNDADDAAAELSHAEEHFFLVNRYKDPFGAVTTITFDSYDLLIQHVRDPLGSIVTVGERDTAGAVVVQGNDYRFLQARLITDANGNRSAASFDALGMVVGTAVMGKRDEVSRRGDLIDGFIADLPDDIILDHLTNPLADPHAILQRATTRTVYDLFAYARTKHEARPSPCVLYSLVRETHDADLAPGALTQVQHGFTYSDGLGREIQRKIQAEPGPVPRRDPLTGSIVVIDGDPQLTDESIAPRWVGTGWTVFNNKGFPVRQFEPFFSDRHGFEADTRVGVSTIPFYDPVGRVVGTLRPDHSWDKAILGAWRQEIWDVNDTVLTDPTTDPELRDFIRHLPEADDLPTWFEQRRSGAMGPHERAAAVKTANHAATPAVSFSDSLDRTFLTIAHNRFTLTETDPPTEALHSTRIVFDIEGNQRAVIDTLGRTILRCDYDMLGRQLHHQSMDAGARWSLSDVAGKPIYAWDSRDHRFRVTYDTLQRHLQTFLSRNASSEQLIGQTVYGEGEPDPETRNLRGKPFQFFDQAGLVISEDYDFKDNLLSAQRRLVREYKAVIDWSTSPELEPETFTSSNVYDALNRPVSVAAPDGSVYRPIYSEANLLQAVTVNIRGAPAPTALVTNIDHDAKGQRQRVDYANGVTTRYEYDRLTVLLRRLVTTRASDQAVLQDLAYSYDPAGNISAIDDSAQPTLYFANQSVDASTDYTYDALYRLIRAEGREHIGQTSQSWSNWNDQSRSRLPQPGDGQAMRRYVERYEYDAAGNLLTLAHRATDGNWQRSYAYEDPSLIEPIRPGNRLSSSTVGGLTETYAHDDHGNLIALPHLALMRWTYNDELAATARQAVASGAPETTYYVYDASGHRVRKITERQNGTRRSERITLGGFEVYRDYDAAGLAINLQRETLHVMDDQRRIALIETRSLGNDGSPQQLIRYQLGNHLGSASLELSDAGEIISYEEYTPYGATSYQAVRSQTETPKRYRFIGCERDEESGFYLCGMRYHAPWLGRWASCDPAGLAGGLNPYAYAHGNPIRFIDPLGLEPEPVNLPANTPQDAEGNYLIPGEIIEIVDKAPVVDELESARRRGLIDVVSREEFERQIRFQNRDNKSDYSWLTGPPEEWYWTEFPEEAQAEAEAKFDQAVSKEYKRVTDDLSVSLSKSYRRMEAAYNVGRGIAIGTGVAVTVLFGGAAAIAAESSPATFAFAASAYNSTPLVIGGALVAGIVAPPGVDVPGPWDDVSKTLKTLGVFEQDVAKFAKGEKVWGQIERGSAKVLGYFQLGKRKVTAGVLELKSNDEGGNMIRAILTFRQQATALAKQLGVKTLRLEANTVVNTKEVPAYLQKMGFKPFKNDDYSFFLNIFFD